jgi:hypothetical protein
VCVRVAPQREEAEERMKRMKELCVCVFVCDFFNRDSALLLCASTIAAHYRHATGVLDMGVCARCGLDNDKTAPLWARKVEFHSEIILVFYLVELLSVIIFQ